MLFLISILLFFKFIWHVWCLDVWIVFGYYSRPHSSNNIEFNINRYKILSCKLLEAKVQMLKKKKYKKKKKKKNCRLGTLWTIIKCHIHFKRTPEKPVFQFPSFFILFFLKENFSSNVVFFQKIQFQINWHSPLKVFHKKSLKRKSPII